MSIIGCGNVPNQPLVSRLISTSVVLYIIAAAVTLLVIMAAAYYSRQKGRDVEDMKTSLIKQEKNCKMIIDTDSLSAMHMDENLEWKPPAFHQFSPHSIQPVNTMSTTASTSRFYEEKIQTEVGGSLLGEDRSACSDPYESSSFGFCESPLQESTMQIVSDVDDVLISPIPTAGDGSSSEEEGNFVFEDGTPSPTSPDDNQAEEKLEEK
jgi:hypothetical protein